MNISKKALAGYLIDKGLDRDLSTELADTLADRSWSGTFSEQVSDLQPQIGRRGALQQAACNCLHVKGLSNYPLGRVAALVAILADESKSSESLNSILSLEQYFEVGKVQDLLNTIGAREALEYQFGKSRSKGRGFFGLFS